MGEESSELALPLRSEEIQAILPHRYPFLFVDSVTAFLSGEFAEGVKNTSNNESFFQGHFPGRPIMPGVLILEALAQLGAIFAKLSSGGSSSKSLPSSRGAGTSAGDSLVVFSGVDSFRFRRQVIPGDIIELRAEYLRARLGLWKMKGVAKVGGEVVAEGVLMATELSSPAS